MNNEMMSGSAEMVPEMMLGMGLMCVLVAIVLILSIAGLIKYLFFSKKSENHEVSSDDKHGF